VSKRTRSRRFALSPNVEMVERRNLQGILSGTEVGQSLFAAAGEPVTPQIQLAITPGTKINPKDIKEILWGDGAGVFSPGHDITIRKSGKRFLIVTLPAHTYTHVGSFTVIVTIKGKQISYNQEISPF
jgi:hypothetical protein